MADIFLLAVAAAFYPTLLAIVILILSRPRPVRLLAAYLAGGMLVSVGIGCLIVFALEGVGPPSRNTTGPAVDIAVGTLSLLVAWFLATGRSLRPARNGHNAWTTRAMGHDSVAVAFLLGIVLDLPSVWYLAALKDISEGGHTTAVDVALIVAFNLIMFVLIEVPLVAYLVAPERATLAVGRFNAWLHAHSRRIGEVIAGAVGIYLVVRGLVRLI